MATDFIENAKSVQVSEYTKQLIMYYAQLEVIHQGVKDLERKFQDETDGWEITGIFIDDKFEDFMRVMEGYIGSSARLNAMFTKCKEV